MLIAVHETGALKYFSALKVLMSSAVKKLKEIVEFWAFLKIFFACGARCLRRS